MPLCEKPTHIFEPNPLACGQAVLAMLTGENMQEIFAACGTERETNLKTMFSVLDAYGIKFSRQRHEVTCKENLPRVAILSLETPKCWHWSLFFEGLFYDPEYGVLSDFPPSARRYYFEILE